MRVWWIYGYLWHIRRINILQNMKNNRYLIWPYGDPFAFYDIKSHKNNSLRLSHIHDIIMIFFSSLSSRFLRVFKPYTTSMCCVVLHPLFIHCLSACSFYFQEKRMKNYNRMNKNAYIDFTHCRDGHQMWFIKKREWRKKSSSFLAISIIN